MAVILALFYYQLQTTVAGKQDFSLYVIALFLVTLLLLGVGVIFKIMYDKYPVMPLDEEPPIPGAETQAPGTIQTVLLPGPPPAMIVKKSTSAPYLNEGELGRKP